MAVDLGKLARMHAAGTPMKDLVKIFGLCERSIRRHLAKIENKVPAAVLRDTAQVNRAVENTMDIQAMWYSLHQEAHAALDAMKAEDNTEGVIKAIRLLQQSVDQALRLAELLHDWKKQQEFQAAVLETIEEVDPDVQDRIIKRLRERQSLRFAVSRS